MQGAQPGLLPLALWPVDELEAFRVPFCCLFSRSSRGLCLAVQQQRNVCSPSVQRRLALRRRRCVHAPEARVRPAGAPTTQMRRNQSPTSPATHPLRFGATYSPSPPPRARKLGAGGGVLSAQEGRPQAPAALAQHARHLSAPLRGSTSKGHASLLTVVTPSIAARQPRGPPAASLRSAGASHGRASSTELTTGAVVSNCSPGPPRPGCRCQVRCQAGYGAWESSASVLAGGALNLLPQASPPV